MDEHAPTRRTVLKRAAAAGIVAGWTAPLILSSSASADSGTVKCQFKPTGGINPTFSATRTRTGTSVSLTAFTIVAPVGTCACSAVLPTFEYAFYGQVDTSSFATGWQAAATTTHVLTAASATNAFTLTLRAGLRVTCKGRGATNAVYCRFGSFGPTAVSGQGVGLIVATAMTALTPGAGLGVTC